MTLDFTCSVSEFTSSTSSIHVFPYMNSSDSAKKLVSTRVYHYKFFTRWHMPVLTQYDSCKTRSKLVTTGRTHVFMWIHHVLVERYQLWTGMTHANWFRNGSFLLGTNRVALPQIRVETLIGSLAKFEITR